MNGRLNLNGRVSGGANGPGFTFLGCKKSARVVLLWLSNGPAGSVFFDRPDRIDLSGGVDLGLMC